MKKKLSKQDIWIILPSFNEASHIKTVLSKLRGFSKNIIVVDDGSSDSTAKIARNYTKHVLSHSINLGKGAALKTGCDYAFKKLKAGAVIVMDSDDQHNPAELPEFMRALQENDMVFGVRAFDNNMPLFRIVMNRLASVIIYFLFGEYIADIPSGFKAFNKKAYQKIRWQSSDYTVEMEIAARTAKYKLKFKEVNIQTIYLDFDRGMTILDTLRMITKILSWKFSL